MNEQIIINPVTPQVTGAIAYDIQGALYGFRITGTSAASIVPATANCGRSAFFLVPWLFISRPAAPAGVAALHFASSMVASLFAAFHLARTEQLVNRFIQHIELAFLFDPDLQSKLLGGDPRAAALTNGGQQGFTECVWAWGRLLLRHKWSVGVARKKGPAKMRPRKSGRASALTYQHLLINQVDRYIRGPFSPAPQVSGARIREIS